MIFNYLDELSPSDLKGRYKSPSDGKAKIFFEVLENDFYKISDSNLSEIAYGKITLNYDKINNLGKAELNHIDNYGFYLKFDDECLTNGISMREYGFWQIG